MCLYEFGVNYAFVMLPCYVWPQHTSELLGRTSLHAALVPKYRQYGIRVDVNYAFIILCRLIPHATRSAHTAGSWRLPIGHTHNLAPGLALSLSASSPWSVLAGNSYTTSCLPTLCFVFLPLATPPFDKFWQTSQYPFSHASSAGPSCLYAKPLLAFLVWQKKKKKKKKKKNLRKFSEIFRNFRNCPHLIQHDLSLLLTLP